jgi:hypothetical protein
VQPEIPRRCSCREREHTLGAFVAVHGDDLQFGSKKEGRVADVFNALAEGLALMSYWGDADAPILGGGARFPAAPFDWRDASELMPEEAEFGCNWADIGPADRATIRARRR